MDCSLSSALHVGSDQGVLDRSYRSWRLRLHGGEISRCRDYGKSDGNGKGDRGNNNSGTRTNHNLKRSSPGRPPAITLATWSQRVQASSHSSKDLCELAMPEPGVRVSTFEQFADPKL